MQGRSSSSVLLLYVGVIAAALAVIALGLTTIVKASTSMSHTSARDKTLLELQVDSSRQIRQALATTISIPPLAPITARPARDLRDTAAVQANKSLRTKLPQGGMDAMAMDQSGTSSSSASSSAASSASSSAARYTVHDRHSANW